MEKKPRKPSSADQELQELRARVESLSYELEEAKETLTAIQTGAVDALVVKAPEGQRIFTLEGAERPYRTIIEQMQEGAVTLSYDGTIHYCNLAFAQMLQRHMETIVGSRVQQYIWEADRHVFADLLKRARSTNAYGEVGLEIADGHLLPVHLGLTLVAEGDHGSICMLVTDLSQRKEYEARLLQLNEQLEDRVLQRTAELRTVLDTAPVAIWIAADPKCRQIVGNAYANEIVMNRPLAGNVSPTAEPSQTVPAYKVFKDGAELTADQLPNQVAARTGQPVKDEEYTLVFPDGRSVQLLMGARPLVNNKGQVTGSVAAGIDIGRVKQAEMDQALAAELLRVLNQGAQNLHQLIRKSLRLLRKSIDCDAVGLRFRQGDDWPYYEQDRASNDFAKEQGFLCAGGGTRALPGNPNRLPDCACGLVLSGRTDPSMPCFTSGGSFWTNHAQKELPLLSAANPPNGPVRHCTPSDYQSIAMLPIHAGGQIIGLLQLNDHREGRFTLDRIRFFESLADNLGLALRRHEAEESLAAALGLAEEAKTIAETANKAKDHFLAVLSHELRNPLNPVLATATLLRQDPRFDKDTREQLEVIHRNAELEARLIDDLLDVTRIERGKVELDRQPVELGAVIQQAIEVCRPDIEARKLALSIDLASVPCVVSADPARLQQVFWNLIKNAVKFSPTGGHIAVHCSAHPDGYAVAEVTDSGEGIAPQALARIFKAFEQAERSITRQFGGLGLGLAISRGLVEMHGGTISARSKGRGKGATFTVRLPLLAAGVQAPSASAPPPRTAPSRPLRILLVEDHADSARIMARLLSADGHSIQTAADVATALKLAAEQPFDLLLSDLGLPDGTGLELLRSLRARGVKAPAIALSGYGQESDLRATHDAGFVAHLTKPLVLSRLQEAIATVTA